MDDQVHQIEEMRRKVDQLNAEHRAQELKMEYDILIAQIEAQLAVWDSFNNAVLESMKPPAKRITVAM